MYKIAVIGDRDSVLGFRALGLDVFPTEDTDAGRRTLHRLAQEDYAVIYITEQLAQQLTAEIARYKDAPLPAVILIPGQDRFAGHRRGPALHGRGGTRRGRGYFLKGAREWVRSSKSPARWWWQTAWRTPTWRTWCA